jgi:hypothetical protein
MQCCTRWTAHFTLKPWQQGHYHIHTEYCTLPADKKKEEKTKPNKNKKKKKQNINKTTSDLRLPH